MQPSVVARKIISVAALGLALLITLVSAGFFFFMGWEFGYKDMKCQYFSETRKFAEELTNTLYHLEDSAYWVETYDYKLPQTGIYLTEMHYQPSVLSCEEEVCYSLEEWMYDSDYYFEADDYGISYVYATENEEYNDDWYATSLNSKRIQDAEAFSSFSHDDYVELIMTYAKPNSTDVGAFSEEDFQDFITGEGYELGSIESTEADADEEFIDADFSANSYIGYYDGVMFVYSPDEDMFYSSLYGWYQVPDTMYFITEDLYEYRDIELLFLQFTSKEEILRQKFDEEYMEYIRASEDLKYEKRNIAYYVVSDKGKYSNVENLDALLSCNQYICIKTTPSGEYTTEFHNFQNKYLTDEYVTGIMQYLEILHPKETLYIGIYVTYPAYDAFLEGNQLFKTYYPLTLPALIIAIVMGIISVALFIRILWTSGRVSKEDKTICLLFVDKIPIEIMLIITGIGCSIMLSQCYREMQQVLMWKEAYISDSILFFMGYGLFMTGFLSLVRKGKAKQLLDKSLIRWTIQLVKRMVVSIARQKNLMARTVELFMLYWMIMLFGCGLLLVSDRGWGFLSGLGIIVILNIATLGLLLKQAKGEQSIRDATKALAEGNLEYKPKSVKRLSTEQEIIDNINHLSDGLQKAVEKSIYDERMKAELITNVSHDIKTPLTSIINYVDLIKRENIEDEKVLHYIEVLDRKSQRLKQLTEDLVEVSKITTGNIELERVPIDFGELLRQSIGEFEDKFAEQELQIVDNIQEHSYMIFADGRRTFRILENLFQNIYKYAMPKTRVYIDLRNQKEHIELSIKNISKAPLNIDAKELMERFVRGDQSRTTEGSGLGLSIAQDLVKLQDGEFQIYLDGDLFKVVITFPEFISKEVIDVEITQELPESKPSGEIENNYKDL